MNRVQGAASLQALKKQQQVAVLYVDPQQSVDLNPLGVVRVRVVGLVIRTLSALPRLDVDDVAVANLIFKSQF